MNKERKGRYNYEELTILHQYFKSEGKDILKRLPGRTWNSVLKAAIHEGLHDNTIVWLPEEDAILFNNQNLTAAEIAKLMPWRTQRSITVRRSKLGCPHRICWTAEEEAILRECMNTDEACERINRSRVAILKIRCFSEFESSYLSYIFILPHIILFLYYLKKMKNAIFF